MPKVRVLIVDDHEVVRLGLRGVLETDGEVTIMGEAADGQSAVQEAKVLKPDVVLMDVRMPGTDGIEACRMIRQESPATKVVMLTSHGDEQAVFAAIMAGASGYLLKNTGKAGILAAIKTAAAGQSLLDPSVTARVLARLRDLAESSQDKEVALLSDREKEILPLVARGKTNKEIAATLVISDNTVRNHISHILEKLGLTSRSGAATFAATHGLLDDVDSSGPTTKKKPQGG